MKLRRTLLCIVAILLSFAICGCGLGQKPPVGIESYSGNASVSGPDDTDSSSVGSTPSVPSSPSTPSTPQNNNSSVSGENDSSNQDPADPSVPSTPNDPVTPEGGGSDDNGESNPSGGNTTPEPEPPASTKYRPVGEDERFCYTSTVLTEKQRLLYLNIRNAVKAQQTTLELNQTARFSKDDLKLVMLCIDTDFPEYYWLTGEYSYNILGSIVTSVTFKYRSFNDSYTASMNNIVEDFVDSLPKNLSEYELELRAHDFLCNRITYDSKSAQQGASNDSHTYSAYGALVKRSVVCEGYARAMVLLMNRVGIHCTLVRGNDGGGHMWNLIQIGGKWYHLDVTWDDPVGASNYNHFYFNLTSKQLLANGRTIDPTWPSTNNGDFNVKIYNCTETSANYFAKNGLILDGNGDKEKIVAALKSAKAAGKKLCEFYAVSPSAFANLNDDSAAEELSEAVFSTGIGRYSISTTSAPGKFMITW